MERRIISLPVHQTSLIMAVTAAIFGFVVALLTMPFTMMTMASMQAVAPEMKGFGMGLGAGMLFLIPVLYFLMGYIGTAIFTLVFNQAASRLGGLPVVFADAE